MSDPANRELPATKGDVQDAAAKIIDAVDRKRSHEVIAVDTMVSDVRSIRDAVLWLKRKWEQFTRVP